MRVFFLNPPYAKYFIRSARWTVRSISGSNWYPIWLAYACGLLEKEGFAARILDALVDGLSLSETVNAVNDFHPQICVVYSSLESKASDIAVARAIKEKTGCLVVFVGPWVSACPQEFLQEEPVDIACLGEFDETILALSRQERPENTAGILYKKEGVIFENPARAPVAESRLDDFPFVSDIYRRHLKIRNYHQAPQLYPFVDLFTGRGCEWGRCTFCLWPFTMNKGFPYRKRKIANVVDEFRYIKKELPFAREVYIQDDTLGSARAREISLAILENDIHMIWSGYARVDLDFATLKLMRDSGCRCLHVGYESADDRILAQCAKGTNRSMAEEFTLNARKLGLIIHADFIIGLPGETPQTIKETISWAKGLPVHSYQFAVPHVYPKTPLYAYLQRNNLLSADKINYPNLSYKELILWSKKAIRECHLNPGYALRLLKAPRVFFRSLYYGRFVLKYLLSS